MAEEEKVTAVAEEATSMADYEKELEASFKKLEEGDMITGTVIAVDEEEITLDLRYYTEGIIKVSDYSREPGFMVKEEVNVGDEVTATVIGRQSPRLYPVIPRGSQRCAGMGQTASVKRRQNRAERYRKRHRQCRCHRIRGRNPWIYPGFQTFPELRGRSERIPEQGDTGTGF